MAAALAVNKGPGPAVQRSQREAPWLEAAGERLGVVHPRQEEAIVGDGDARLLVCVRGGVGGGVGGGGQG